METVPYFAIALLYILGGYAFNLMVKSAIEVDAQDDPDAKPIHPRMITVMTVVWVVVMIMVAFRPSKKAA